MRTIDNEADAGCPDAIRDLSAWGSLLPRKAGYIDSSQRAVLMARFARFISAERKRLGVTLTSRSTPSHGAVSLCSLPRSSGL